MVFYSLPTIKFQKSKLKTFTADLLNVLVAKIMVIAQENLKDPMGIRENVGNPVAQPVTYRTWELVRSLVQSTALSTLNRHQIKPFSEHLKTTNLTLSQTSPGFYMSAIQVF